ncbi:MAG: diguanylate cyclase, partial [Clostridiales bacterium]|nr:diguanylate cyclase [Clostridiales bacterium]
GLEMGADDYISKPFSEAIVKLRVRNQIKIVNQIRAIKSLSNMDQLTKIANKHSFNQRLSMEWHRAFREKLPISILMIDIDKFKEYNDTYGHLQGDAVLRAVAHTLTCALKRPADFAARWGGEEFSVLLPAVDMNGALVVAELIRETVEKTVILCVDGRATSVTISVGVNSQMPVVTDPTDAAANDFVHKADMALYAAKEAGRNRVCRA